jgi:hypothetical protein
MIPPWRDFFYGSLKKNIKFVPIKKVYPQFWVFGIIFVQFKENQGEAKMKAIIYISVFAALLVSSCTTGRFNMSSEYDDLYYSKSDRPVVSERVVSQDKISDPSTEKYYDNIYSGDTLIADGYNDAVDFDGSMFYNKDESPFEYADDYSYSNRLRRFYGNYFDPYWRDPFYYGWGGGYYPYFYDPYWYDPFYYRGGYGSMFFSYGFNYGYGFGGYYGNYFPGYYPGYYPGNYPIYGDENKMPAMGRRQTYSTLSSNYSNITPSRKSGYQTESGISGEQRRTSTLSSQGGTTTDSRRTGSVQSNTRQGINSEMRNMGSTQGRREGEVSSNVSSSRPEYNSVNRSYTPSYNNPRMSERPSYNNSRVSEGTQNSNVSSGRSSVNSGNYGTRSTGEGAGTGRVIYDSGRSGSGNASQGNSIVRYPSSNNYYVPSSSSRSEGGDYGSRSSSYSSGSGNSGSSSYSGSSSVGSSVGSSGGGGGGGYESRSSGGGSGTRR